MKKLVLMFVAIAAMSFASCNGNKQAAPAADSTADSTQVDSTATDSAATDSAAADSAAAPADTAAQAQ
ncbi:MAG: entericidin [Prevotella sp.]|jgi:hypothetical protein